MQAIFKGFIPFRSIFYQYLMRDGINFRLEAIMFILMVESRNGWKDYRSCCYFGSAEWKVWNSDTSSHQIKVECWKQESSCMYLNGDRRAHDRCYVVFQQSEWRHYQGFTYALCAEADIKAISMAFSIWYLFEAVKLEFDKTALLEQTLPTHITRFHHPTWTTFVFFLPKFT